MILGKSYCCVEKREAGGVFHVNADGWIIQMFGQHKMDTSEKLKKGQQPTKLDFAGQLVNVPENPGLFARNR